MDHDIMISCHSARVMTMFVVIALVSFILFFSMEADWECGSQTSG